MDAKNGYIMFNFHLCCSARNELAPFQFSTWFILAWGCHQMVLNAPMELFVFDG